ncbi:MAG: GNAT family N-acetyltransferase [Caldimonas sp.]
MPVLIEPAGTDRFADLQRLYALLEVSGDPVVSEREAARRYAAILARPDHELYVAVDDGDGAVVGTYALAFLPGLTHGARDSAIVEDVVVAADHRGRGIGRQMMEDALRRCRARDCYKLVLSSHLQRDAAHRFYEGLGFAKHGFSFLMNLEAPARSTP